MQEPRVSTTASAAVKLPPVVLTDEEVERLMRVFVQGRFWR
jgi:hypothetical protein